MAEPLLKLLSVLLLSGNVESRKWHFREIGRGRVRTPKIYIYIYMYDGPRRRLSVAAWPPLSPAINMLFTLYKSLACSYIALAWLLLADRN